MPVDALADLADGYYLTVSNFTDGWTVGLIFADGAREQDLDDAESRERDVGRSTLWLADEDLFLLATGRGELADNQGNRYLITVQDVDQLEELLDERRACDDED